MKKLLLFALPLLAMLSVSCEKDNGNEIIEFKDPNFLKALLVVQEIELYDEEQDDYVFYMMDVDENKDGKVSVNEASKVKGLALYDIDNDESFNIREMSEIKYFTALEMLEFSGNELTALDLSNNTVLEQLFCEESQLTTLYVTNNTALTYLRCSHNELTTLDLGNNTTLTYLHCSDNELTELDLSKNTALTYLRCSDNNLTKLDLSKHTALERLYCENNPLEEIKLNRNNKLSKEDKEELEKKYNVVYE